MLVYVDDILLIGDSAAEIDALKAHLHSLFTIKDLGLAKYFLGLKFARSSHGLLVSQQKYLHDILNDANMLGAKVAPTPLPPGLKLSIDSGSLLSDLSSYRRLIGRLLYLRFTRPDVSFAVQQLSQFLQHPRSSHWDAAVHFVISEVPLPLESSSPLVALSILRFTLTPLGRPAPIPPVLFLGIVYSWGLLWFLGRPRSKPPFLAPEAEYRSMGAAVCELLWFSYLLRAFNIQFPTPIPFWCDNQAAIHITANPVFHERTKHLDIDCHLVRDQFKLGFILPSHIPGRDQLADIITKSSHAANFARLLGKLGLASVLQLEGGDVTSYSNSNSQ
ncbi:UNVERIFIED_CONTAM: Retrovirus-related Pol polyprotein from transposon RE1 [Sesamum indicum]